MENSSITKAGFFFIWLLNSGLAKYLVFSATIFIITSWAVLTNFLCLDCTDVSLFLLKKRQSVKAQNTIKMQMRCLLFVATCLSWWRQCLSARRRISAALSGVTSDLNWRAQRFTWLLEFHINSSLWLNPAANVRILTRPPSSYLSAA